MIDYPNWFGILAWMPYLLLGGVRLSEKLLNHERIHTAQMKEMLYFGFYLWYFVEWLVRLPGGNAYLNISFEREAYGNQTDSNYVENRRMFSGWMKEL